MIIDGGHFAPATAAEIIHKNKAIQKHDPDAMHLLNINLKSVLIGNGLTDPLIQYKSFAKMACENSYGPVLDQDTCDAMDEKYPACADLIQQCYNSPNVTTCKPAYTQCNKDLLDPYTNAGKNTFDVRKPCDGQGALCYAIYDAMQTYVNRPEVLEAIGSRPDSFESCNMDLFDKITVSAAAQWENTYSLAHHRVLIGCVPS